MNIVPDHTVLASGVFLNYK